MSTMSFEYKSTANPNYWCEYLDRNLTRKEMCMLDNVRIEKRLNNYIEKIYHTGNKHNLFIPYLTSMSGNCFFESLEFLKLYDNAQTFRDAIGTLMLLFKHKKYFIPGQEHTLFELFDFTNEIECVYCQTTDLFYKYNFDTMCLDIMNSGAWDRLPTQMIMTVISIMMNIEFIIVHDNGHITNLATTVNDQTIKIHLGLIGELHYIPMMLRRGYDYENNVPIFSKASDLFHKWACHHAFKLGRYTNNSSKYDEKVKTCDTRHETETFSKLDSHDGDNNLVRF